MDRELIIRLAREAGFVVDDVSQQYQPNCIFHTHHMVDELLERFAALVAAHEREECAKLCEMVPLLLFPANPSDCADLIRSRYGMTEVIPAQVIHSDAAAQQLHAIDLLKLCHAYLRGAKINTPTGRKPINPDQLARQINLYLNEHTTQEQTRDQTQRDPAGSVNKTSL